MCRMFPQTNPDLILYEKKITEDPDPHPLLIVSTSTCLSEVWEALLVKTEANKAMNALLVSAVTTPPDTIGCDPVFLIQPFTSNVGAETPRVVFDASCKCHFRWVCLF